MKYLPTLHVLAGHRVGLGSALHVALEQFTRIRVWGAVPPKREVQADDLIVVDLSDPPHDIDPRLLAGFARTPATLWLVLGDTPVAPSWLEIAHLPEVRVIPCRLSHGAFRYSAIVTEVLERVRGPTGECIAALVLQTEPVLRPLRSLVQAICLDPWRMRRPRDLAAACAISLTEVKHRCTACGFARVEHFIICVRLVAYEQLVATTRMPVAKARMLAGFDDASNMRRHGNRAARRSPPVAQVLESSHRVWRRPRVAGDRREVG